MKNRMRAISVAPAAIFPKPNMAAIIAITRKINVQRSIQQVFIVKNEECLMKILFID